MYEDKNPIAQLVHLYVDGAFSRRELVRRVTRKTGSVAAAAAALAAFPEEMSAQATPVPPGVRVAENDAEIVAGDVTFPGLAGVVYGYQAVPKKAYQELQPGVIIVHENRGLVDHIKDVARRAAKAGFNALAVDLLSRQGGTAQFTEPTQQTAAYNRTTQVERREGLMAGLDHMKRMDTIIYNRIGIMGFCAGGGNTWDFAVNFEEIGAAVPFYGTPPAAADLDRLKVPVLGIYAERDRNLTQQMLVAADTLSRSQKIYGLSVYEGVGHAFHNDTGAAYNAEAAMDAWARSMAFFNKWLRRAG
ncbi:MAG: dienelactone hydrolase family protein [Acidobacteria bacterium]|nr:dienelactone hydrolase family protein [Acidobacteriota bacterium]